jgi:hypothetical protein
MKRNVAVAVLSVSGDAMVWWGCTRESVEIRRENREGEEISLSGEMFAVVVI